MMPAMDMARPRERVEETPTPQQAINVDLSASRGVRHARELLSQLSDVRMDRVSEIRDAIQDGSYKIDSYEIARRMVDEALRESITKRKR